MFYECEVCIDFLILLPPAVLFVNRPVANAYTVCSHRYSIHGTVCDVTGMTSSPSDESETTTVSAIIVTDTSHITVSK